MSSEPLAADVAYADQIAALLHDLVRVAREHADTVCRWPGECAGELVADRIDQLNDEDLLNLTYRAVAELARPPSTKETRPCP